MKKNIQMSLKKKWFEMTKSGIKKEDYREITPYWCKRLVHVPILNPIFSKNEWEELCEDFKEGVGRGYNNELEITIDGYSLNFKKFDTNIMTLGYPKSGDTERTLKLEHAGIEIRTGNPEWGAEPGKLYFVIKHGEIINN